MRICRYFWGAALLFASCWNAQAQDALVEDATTGAPVEAYEFLNAGRTFQLTPAHVVKIGYLNSCTSEVITGGAVTIGTNRSKITGGDIRRETFPCDMKTSLSQAERNESGASAWRNDSVDSAAFITNLSPILIFEAPAATVTIVRTDIPERTIRLTAHSTVIDLDARGIQLEAGGIYSISAGGKNRNVEIDFEASDAGGPLFLRAVRF